MTAAVEMMGFWVPGHPVPLGRPRFSRGRFPLTEVRAAIDKGRLHRWSSLTLAEEIKALVTGKRVTARATPRQKEFETRVREAFIGAAAESAGGGDLPWVRPVRLAAQFFVTRQGDVDNYIKAVLDALSGYAWVDDQQVMEVRGVLQFDEYRPEGSQLDIEFW